MPHKAFEITYPIAYGSREPHDAGIVDNGAFVLEGVVNYPALLRSMIACQQKPRNNFHSSPGHADMGSFALG